VVNKRGEERLHDFFSPLFIDMNIKSQNKTILFYLGIILLGIIIYSNNLRGPFTYDDFHTIVENPYIKQPQHLTSLFDLSSITKGSASRSMYRPILMVTFFLNYTFGGLDPLGYHIVNILLHILSAIVVFMLVKSLLGPGGVEIEKEKIAFFCALLFVSHPIQTETVNYIACRSELLAGFFLLLSFYLYIRSSVSKKEINVNPSFYIGSLVAFTFGLLCKENIFILPLLILIYDYLYIGWKNAKDFIVRFKKYYLAFLIIAVAYIVLRVFLLGHFLGGLKTTPVSRSFFENLITQARVVMLHYPRLLLFPFGLSIDHYVPASKSIMEPTVIISLLLLLVVVTAIFIVRRKNKAVTFFTLWFFINLAPTSLIPLHIIMNEHRLYLSSISFCFLISYGLISLSCLKKNSI